MAKKRGSKRKRVSRDTVRKNAQQGAGGNFFNLPKGIKDWAPKEAGKYLLDILPYEVSINNHPDAGNGIEKGHVWYKFPFAVHFNVGAADASVVCPASVGQPCPICEERDKYKRKDKDRYADNIKQLTPQRWTAMNIIDPEDEDKTCVFAMSIGKFYNKLKEELDEGEAEILLFFEIADDAGKTLKVRFSPKTFEGSKYLQATRIDFIDREDMDEEDTFEGVACLDEIFNILPYNRLKAMFLQVEENDEDDEGKAPEDTEDEDEEEEKPRRRRGKREKKEEPDDEGDADEEEKEEEEKPRRRGRRKKEEKDDEGDGDADSDADEGDADEEEEEKKSKRSKKDKKGKDKKNKKTPKCPAGGKYGEDIDKFDDCDDCPHWNGCDAASDE